MCSPATARGQAPRRRRRTLRRGSRLGSGASHCRHLARRRHRRSPSVKSVLSLRRRLAKRSQVCVVIAAVQLPSRRCRAFTILIGIWSDFLIFPGRGDRPSPSRSSSAVLAVIADSRRRLRWEPQLGRAPRLHAARASRRPDHDRRHTGIVIDISLSCTALSTDEGRKIFVPNTKMVSTTPREPLRGRPRRLVTVALVRLGARLGDARRITLGRAAQIPHGADLDLEVQIGELEDQSPG